MSRHYSGLKMAEKNTKELKLKVAEAIQDDVNKGIVRIDSGYMRDIGVAPGDIVELKGERKTVAIVDRAYPGDIGLNIIRMDGIARRNAKTGIGELVIVKKGEVVEAKKITIAPARKGVMIRASAQLFKQGLLGRAMTKGDIVSLGGTTRRRTTMSQSPFFEDIFNIFDEDLAGFGFGGLKFVVVDTTPKQNIFVSDLTEVIFNPEAVEVTEKEFPEVTYEDIGGLSEEIKKVREMVELPLKHPEIFERLGIDPPKGVLLHGPPGTGKTLLAKAVANESNSHFILINGPEIMCVDGETNILTNPKGYIKAKDVFSEAKKNGKSEGKEIEVIKLKKPISTYSVNEKNGKIEKAHITHATKLLAPSYEVKLGDGNNIIVSHNQPFLTVEKGKLTWKRLEQLKKGDFVAKIRKLNIKGMSHRIGFSDKKIVYKNGKSALKSRNISRSNWIKLPKKTTLELMEFIGLTMSDGHIDKRHDAVVFANDDFLLRQRFKELAKKLFDAQTNEYKDGRTTIYSRILCLYMNELGIGSGKKELKIPNYFYKLPENEIKAFIRGYFDGDGTVAITPFTTKKGKKQNYPTPIIYSKSRQFLIELQSLMQIRVGISTKILEHKTQKGLMHKLIARGHEGREKFLSIGSSCSKLQKLMKIKENQKIKEYENIPKPELLINSLRKTVAYKHLRNKDYYLYGRGKFTRYTLNKFYELARNNLVLDSSVLDEIHTLQNQNLGWEEIKQIDFVGKKELYDFTVDKDSFTASPYLLLHNSKYYGQSEQNLRKKFEDAEKNSPAIIFIDEIDAITSKREETHGEVERRVVAQLLALMDGLNARGKVVVIAASNIPNSLDPALRRPGRFDREIEIGVPNKEGRLNILKIHTRNMPLLNAPKDEEDAIKILKEREKMLKDIAAITHGFVGADMAALAKEAAMIVLRRILPDLKLKEEEPIPKEVLEKLRIFTNDFKDALKIVRPSALREVLIEKPTVRWKDVGGLDNVKQELIEAVEWPLKNPEAFKRLGVKPPKGILVYGPPGTGKTMLAKAVANESEANFILVKGPELLSKWVGESEKAVREIFKKARQTSPTIIFFDEIDSLAPRRGLSLDGHVSERVVNQLLTEMDGLEEMNDVVIIAATNRPDMLDTALLRPGRFDRIILTPVPDKKTRDEIFKVHTQKMPLSKDVNLSDLAEETEGYVGADIEAICREAAILALREDIKSKEVTLQHFEKALEKIAPSVTKEIEKSYEELKNHFTKARARQMELEKPAYMG